MSCRYGLLNRTIPMKKQMGRETSQGKPAALVETMFGLLNRTIPMKKQMGRDTSQGKPVALVETMFK